MKTCRALTKLFGGAKKVQMSRCNITTAHNGAAARDRPKLEKGRSQPSATRRESARRSAFGRNKEENARHRIQEYRRRRDRRIPPSEQRPLPRRAPTKNSWIDRIDEGGYWCWEEFMDGWMSCCGCCSGEWPPEEEDPRDEDTTTTTTFSGAILCQPYQSHLPLVTVHVEVRIPQTLQISFFKFPFPNSQCLVYTYRQAIALGLADHLPTTNDTTDASDETTPASPTYTALSWVGFIPNDPASPVTFPCKYSVEGVRVASFANLPGPLSSTTQTLSPAHLIAVPRDLDAADLALLLAYDYPAWDQLFFGTQRRDLRGQSLLLRAEHSWTPALAAVVRAAVRAGARHVYVVLSSEGPVLPPRLRRQVTLWQDNVHPWQALAAGRMHRILDYRPAEDVDDGMLALLDPERGQYVICAPALPTAAGWCMPALLRRPPTVVVRYVPPDAARRLRDLPLLLAQLSTRALRPAMEAVYVTEVPSCQPNGVVPALVWEPSSGRNHDTQTDGGAPKGE
jgi:hypothetical protein